MARGEDRYESTDESDDDDDDEVLSDDADFRAKGTRKTATAKTRGAVVGGGGGGASTSAVAAASKGKKMGLLPKKGGFKAKAPDAAKDKGYAWEATYKRSWDAVREDEGGSLAGAVRGLLEASKRRRCV